MRAPRRGCRPTSPSTGPPGRRPRTGRGTSANRSTRRRASRSRSCCASSGWRRCPTSKPVLAVLPETSPPIGSERLERSGPTVEIAFNDDLEAEDSRRSRSLRGQLRARRGDPGRRLDPRRPLHLHGRLDRVDARPPGRPEARLPARRRRGVAVPDDIVLVEVDGPVATVTLNRPEARNALNRALRKALPTTLRASSTAVTTSPPSCSPAPTPRSPRGSTSRSSPPGGRWADDAKPRWQSRSRRHQPSRRRRRSSARRRQQKRPVPQDGDASDRCHQRRGHHRGLRGRPRLRLPRGLGTSPLRGHPRPRRHHARDGA